ncbi:hypothetical protein [Methylobacterium sp. sgz302541]|uniref:hypothetical protein n=1 Tax=unclassified Methylobacterium TaxID=2615210 RepID=UPI003D32FD66
MSDETTSGQNAGEAVLPEPVRDHIGQQLRAVYSVEPAKPRFLGDAEVPEPFGPQIEKLETRLKTHAHGTDAVEAALDGILEDLGVPPAPGGETA